MTSTTTNHGCPFHRALGITPKTTTPSDVRPYKEIPGPRGHLLLGSVPELRTGLLPYQEALRATYGDMVRTKLFHLDVVQVSRPELLRDLLVTKASQLRKNKDVGGIRALIGKGLLSNDGLDHARQRRLIEPAFRHERMARYAEIIAARTERRVTELAARPGVNLHEELATLTLEIVCEALFGLDVEEAAEVVGRALDVFVGRAISAWTSIRLPMAIPTASNRAAKRALNDVNELLFKLISERRAALSAGGAAEDADDLLSTLIRASDEEGGMSDAQLRDEVITLMLAGHETTAITLTFTMMLLDENPAEAAKLRAELDEVCGGRTPRFEDLKQLQVTRHIIDEAMRIYPPAYIVGREVAADDFELGGFHIPRGTQVFASQWLLHRDERYFDAPLEFRPERFEDKTWPRGAYAPFGMGGRSCVGMHFALVEAVLLLATFWQRASVTCTGGPIELEPAITLRPKGGLPARVVTRASAEPSVAVA